MIYLTTGDSGSGKTLFTLDTFLKLENRPKYATSFNDFDYDKHNIKLIPSLEYWPNLPDGSAIFCDDADRFFPFDSKEALKISWIKELAAHRHRNFDFYLTTSRPFALPQIVRFLVSQHVHYVYQSHDGTVNAFLWSHFVDKPTSVTALCDAKTTILKISDCFTGAI